MQYGLDISKTATISQRLFSDQVRELYSNAVFGTVAAFINSGILVFVLRAQVPTINLFLWLTCAGFVSLLRLICYWLYRNCPTRASEPDKWNAWFNTTLLLSGAVWGFAAIFLFPFGSIGHQTFLAFVTGGMVAGAARAFTSVIRAFFIYSIPALLPLCIRFFTIGSEIHVAMGVMVLLFLLIISASAIRMHRDILKLLALKYERSELISDLHQEVDRRKAAQHDLARQKEKVEEIVDRRTAQLKHANQRLRAILNYAPLVIWAVDRNGTVTFADGKGLAKLNIAPETAVGKTVSQLSASYRPLIDITERALSGEVICETIHFKEVFFEVRYHPMIDAGERLQGAIGVAIDVTEQTAAKEALRKSQEKYRDLAENINDVLFTVDKAGTITYISPVIQSVLGYGADELIGTQLIEYLPERVHDRILQDMARALEGDGGPREYQFLDKAGQIKWCRISSRPVVDGYEKTGIQGVLVDVTNSKRLEEELQRAQKMEALGTLAGGVAHDLNNILSGIISYPELLLIDLPKDSPLHQPLTTIKRSGENAAAIVQDLLTLARRGIALYELVNMNQVVQDCLDSPEIRSLMRHNPNVRLTTSLQPDLFNVHGSSIHIFKSISNLIHNAVEAMPEGGQIKISTSNRYADTVVLGFDTVKEGEYVVLTILDTGIGIPEQDQARIFEPFYTKKTMGRSGSGLGTAVVWGTVKDHNGYIDLQSTEGKGTKFELFFPATREQLEIRKNPAEISDYKGNGERILVVDDMPAQREIATRILEHLGYQAVAAGSGEEAIEFVRHHHVDLLILDMIMDPGIDGYDTFCQIKSLRPDQKAIIVSGYSETDRVRKTQALGAGRYIKKPYTMTDIGKAIKEELGQ